MWRWTAILFSTILLVSRGVDQVDGPGTAGFDHELVDRDSLAQRIQDAHQRWAEAGMSDYSLELSPGPTDSLDAGCGTGGSLFVQVVDGEVTEAVDLLSGCHVEVDEPDRVPLSVEELFGFIEEHLDAEQLEVDFEPEIGYPRSVYIQDGSGITELSVGSLTEGEADTRTAEEILEELEKQREVWSENGVIDYTITVEIGCFCPEEVRGPFEVTVVHGVIESVTMDGERIEPVDESFLTVEGLFSMVEGYAYSDEISVTYAPDGHPSIIDIDPDFNTIDEELFIKVHDLTSTDG